MLRWNLPWTLALPTYERCTPHYAEDRNGAVCSLCYLRMQPSVSGSSEVGMAVVDDVKRIVVQKNFVMMALSDLHSLIGRAIEELNGPESAKQVQPKERKRLLSKLTAMQKKTYFFLVWANEQLDPLFSSTAALVELYSKEKRTARGASLTDASANPISSSTIRIPNTK